MSSSTSSSELSELHRRTRSSRWITVVCILAVLVGLEFVTRRVLFPASKDFHRFATYPEKAKLLANSELYSIALIGNSATDRGVTESVVAEAFARASGVKSEVVMFPADASRINTWHYIAESAFFRPGTHADRMVITFYEDDLADGNAVEIGRLAQFFTTPSDWPSVFSIDLPRFGDQVEFMLASGWATLAASDRVRERLLKILVPNYEDFATFVHLANRKPAPVAAKSSPTPRTYRALERFLAAAAAAKQEVIFVAYPTLLDNGAMPYEFEPEALTILKQAGAPLIDLRLVDTLTPDLYDDEVHLTEAGRRPYSLKLGQALGEIPVRTQ